MENTNKLDYNHKLTSNSLFEQLAYLRNVISIVNQNRTFCEACIMLKAMTNSKAALDYSSDNFPEELYKYFGNLSFFENSITSDDYEHLECPLEILNKNFILCDNFVLHSLKPHIYSLQNIHELLHHAFVNNIESLSV